MQAQAQRQQQSISSQQSLAVVKTLLNASFGCIAYLRNLLPDDNFGEGRLTSAEQGAMSYESASQDTPGGKDRRNYSNVKIKTVTRGFSPEADKLLDYMEHGIFHALERQYLKSFIFAIYLDNEDANNIVEAYTYDFSYRTVPGTDIIVPIMSLGEDLMKLSLGGPGKAADPVARATLKGRAPTLGDVKKSVKGLIKNLITVTQTMDPLPKRRFATFKLFYRDNTPADYEPPFFRPADSEKDKFIFTTHRKSEVPEKISIGSVVTPYHGIDVRVESVVAYLPNNEDNDGPYAGCGPDDGNPFAPVATNNTAALSRQADAQRKDAEARPVVWNAETISALSEDDAEGEQDPDFVNDSGIGLQVPLGKRAADGSIVPIESSDDDGMDVDAEGEAQYHGLPEIAPSRVGKLYANNIRNSLNSIAPTQQLEPTQILPNSQGGGATPVVTQMPAIATDLNESSMMSRGIDTQMLGDLLKQKRNEQDAMTTVRNSDGDMLDLETQVIAGPAEPHGNHDAMSRKHKAKPPVSATSIQSLSSSDAAEIDCACELAVDGEGLLQCEGSCRRWYHVWCMGYHSVEDVRLPATFVCVGCLLRGDNHFDLIRDTYNEIMATFAEIAHFRRAIKVAEMYEPETLKDFKNFAGCQASLAQLLWKRLCAEGFVVQEIIETDAVGLMETQTRAKTKSHKKKTKNKQTLKYVFNKSSKTTAAYQDYFDPKSDAEKKLLGLKASRRKGKSRAGKTQEISVQEIPLQKAPAGFTSAREAFGSDKNVSGSSYGTVNSRILDAGQGPPVDMDSQTQEDTQLAPLLHGAESQTQEDTQLVPVALALDRESQTQEDTQLTSELKRRAPSHGQSRANKKVKVSMAGEGVDIEE